MRLYIGSETRLPSYHFTSDCIYMYYECGTILIDLSWHQLQILWKPYFVTFDYVNIIMINNQATHETPYSIHVHLVTV